MFKMNNLSKAFMLVLSASATNVFAADGTITINGRVLDSTCTLTSDGGSTQGTKNVVVTLPAVKTSEFTALASTAGKTNFQLKIVDSSGAECTSLSGINGVLISAGTDKYLSTNSTALINQKQLDTGVGADKKPIHLQILNLDKAIDFKNPETVKHDKGIIKLASQYYQAVDGAIGAQNVQAVVDYTLIYN